MTGFARIVDRGDAAVGAWTFRIRGNYIDYSPFGPFDYLSISEENGRICDIGPSAYEPTDLWILCERAVYKLLLRENPNLWSVIVHRVLPRPDPQARLKFRTKQGFLETLRPALVEMAENGIPNRVAWFLALAGLVPDTNFEAMYENLLSGWLADEQRARSFDDNSRPTLIGTASLIEQYRSLIESDQRYLVNQAVTPSYVTPSKEQQKAMQERLIARKAVAANRERQRRETLRERAKIEAARDAIARDLGIADRPPWYGDPDAARVPAPRSSSPRGLPPVTPAGPRIYFDDE
jgi:hypothetical protein